ncbi:hypothetical protein EUGRSUZ_H00542 [Eucalyptus grandis]|uniref:Uncharacterized protein n=2 Tax=Eucalyptus grandis TaxID=71139 RepID=A0ACC3JL19_EUCGR|nr:hypothetical protein EUGRSUZ_H00542 [Eucalyptus grandis]
MAMAENWSNLLPELLELCSRRLLLEDWFAFRSVCSTWRAAAFEERFDYPWWMLEDDKNTMTEWAEFYSPFSSQIHRVVLPEVKGKTCFSSRGWILTIGKDWKIHMLNPLSRAASRYRDDVIELPSADKFPSWDPEDAGQSDVLDRTFLAKFVLSASPASSPNYTVMVIRETPKPLGFWKPGNEEWKELTPPDPYSGGLDVIHYRGQFVAVNSKGTIFTCDVDGPDPTAQVISKALEMPSEFRDSIYRCLRQYLVESAGRLLLILGFGQQEHGMASFQVLDIDLDARKWTKLERMGNVSLFVGFNSSFSVQVDEIKQSIKPNCIYFTWCEDIGTYHMEDGRIEFDKEADFDIFDSGLAFSLKQPPTVASALGSC